MLSSQDYKNCQMFESKSMKKKHKAFESDPAEHQVFNIIIIILNLSKDCVEHIIVALGQKKKTLLP